VEIQWPGMNHRCVLQLCNRNVSDRISPFKRLTIESGRPPFVPAGKLLYPGCCTNTTLYPGTRCIPRAEAGFGRGAPMSSPIAKTALVTGASRRIGRAIAEDLAAAGFAVALHANGGISNAEALAATIGRKGGGAVALKADLTDPAAAAGLVERASAALGPLGVVVNNASIFTADEAGRFDEAAFDAHFSLHLKAPLAIAAAFARQKPAGEGGLIVNMIDQRVWALTPRFFSYTLSKSALWTATQTMAQAFAPAGIRVNAIGPGPTLANERQSEADFAAQVSRVPLGHGPALAEFGRTIRYLYETPSITGQMIALDGGQHLAWETPDVADIQE